MKSSTTGCTWTLWVKRSSTQNAWAQDRAIVEMIHVWSFAARGGACNLSSNAKNKCLHNIEPWLDFFTWLVGGFNPFEKYPSKSESSPNRGENKNDLKPPPRWSTYDPEFQWKLKMLSIHRTDSSVGLEFHHQTPVFETWMCPKHSEK